MLLGAIGEEAQHLVSIDWYRQNFVALLNVIIIDVVLAGDNAIIVGLAASRVAPGDAQQGDLLGHRRRGRSAHRVCRAHHQLLPSSA